MPSNPPDRRTRKRLATRQRISDIATALFIQRGFEQVTVDDIAAAADVARMTVFNHFARKEDMFFDLDDQARRDLLAAIATRAPGTSPVEALRQLAATAIHNARPYVRFSENSKRFVETLEASEALKARARALRDEFTELLTAAMAQAVHRPPTDPEAHLAASLLVAAWVVAAHEAFRLYRHHGDLDSSNSRFLALMEQGLRGVTAALAGSPYV